MLHPANWPISLIAAVFLAAIIIILLAGTKMTAFADRLADKTGLGEAMLGGVFLGASTSLPGVTASVTSALDGYPAMAVSNAVGGIAVQTVFLAFSDVFYRKANLEHAAASAENLVQATLLIALLSLLLLVSTGPAAIIGGIHPGTFLILLTYAGGIILVLRTRKRPMWKPRLTAVTVQDRAKENAESFSLFRLIGGFALCALSVFVAGIIVARSGGVLVERYGFSESVVGAFVVAIATSLPELVTCIAAVKRDALTLAVSDITGGNCFDVLFVCVADIFYRQGSIYSAVTPREIFTTSLAIMVNVLLLLGLIQRQERGIANIGFESFLIILVYLGGVLAISLAM